MDVEESSVVEDAVQEYGCVTGSVLARQVTKGVPVEEYVDVRVKNVVAELESLEDHTRAKVHLAHKVLAHEIGSLIGGRVRSVYEARDTFDSQQVTGFRVRGQEQV